MTSVGNNAFQGCELLEKITLNQKSSKGLTSIGNYAFEGCKLLRGIFLPAPLTTLGTQAFANCEALRYVAGMENVKITSVAEGAFLNCKNLEEISLPTSKMTEIKTSAFNGCERLKKVDMPASVKTIGQYAFANCPNLQSIEIPASATTIGLGAFQYCLGLKDLTFKNTASLSIGASAFLGCTHLGEETYVEEHFGRNLKVITFNSNVTLANYAFMNCSELEGVVFQASTTSISGQDVFAGCKNLKYLNIPGMTM